MASILTNGSAMTALQNLTATIRRLDETQTRISSGLRVGKAEDNAAYWSIATTMRSDTGALSTVKDALGLGSATIDVAYTGMNSAIEAVKEIKNKLVAARQPGVDRGKIQSEITELQGILDLTDTTSNGGVDYSVATLDIASLTNSDDDIEDLEQMIAWVDGAVSKMTDSAASLGAVKQRVTLQQDFVASLMVSVLFLTLT